MFGKIAYLFALLAAAYAAIREYPAGVHPAICPDYPNCDPATLARFTPDGQPIPLWGLGYTAGFGGVHAAGAARYPADFNAALCPNYPFCH